MSPTTTRRGRVLLGIAYLGLVALFVLGFIGNHRIIQQVEDAADVNCAKINQIVTRANEAALQGRNDLRALFNENNPDATAAERRTFESYLDSLFYIQKMIEC